MGPKSNTHKFLVINVSVFQRLTHHFYLKMFSKNVWKLKRLRHYLRELIIFCDEIPFLYRYCHGLINFFKIMKSTLLIILKDNYAISNITLAPEHPFNNVSPTRSHWSAFCDVGHWQLWSRYVLNPRKSARCSWP